ncbi:hypothetical protein HK101_009443 [Irineochytrium annulatum]|nr:hypothetical protein HK101_009443 [Irineochytrium annulatum]
MSAWHWATSKTPVSMSSFMVTKNASASSIPAPMGGHPYSHQSSSGSLMRAGGGGHGPGRSAGGSSNDVLRGRSAEPNPDDIEAAAGKSKKYEMAEYGEDADVDNQFEFYSNPNSRRPSVQQPPKADDAHMTSLFSSPQTDSVDAFDDSYNPRRAKRSNNPAAPFSSRTLNSGTGSVQTFETDEEMARRIARDQVELENAPEHKRDEILPKVLYDPLERQKLKSLRPHRPWFLGACTVIQVTLVLVSLILNLRWTGEFIETNPFNVMIGPGPGVLIQMGARFVPCIRNTTLNVQGPVISCPAGVTSDTKALDAASGAMVASCTLEQICGLGGFNGGLPNQWYRFIIPMFLHGGVLHLVVNLLFQVQTGFQLERDFGWWRIACIYTLSGVGGFVFGGNFNGLTPSVGCSGALFGLMACLVIDLFQNWSMIHNPAWELAKLSFTILVSFLIGMLPYIDNFAHVGGFFVGVFAGLIFMPTIHYSKRDKYIKLGLMIASVPALILVYVFLVRGFYAGNSDCTWCKYINCIPGLPWCESKWNQAIAVSTGSS